MIIIDTARADRFGCYGYSKPTTPRMDVVARDAFIFERFYSSSPWTAPSFGTFFTGVSPAIHRAGKRAVQKSQTKKKVYGRELEPLRPSLVTLAEALGDIPSHAIINNSFLHPVLGYHRGFDRYDFKRANNKQLRAADAVTDLAIHWIQQNKNNAYLLVLHYFDPHMDYSPPESFREKFTAANVGRLKSTFGNLAGIKNGTFIPTDAEKRHIIGLYDAELAFVDHHVGRLLDYYDKEAQGRNAWIVLTADHGEEHFDHGDFEHGHRYEDEVVRLPLIVRPPERLKQEYQARTISTSTRLVDIYPTILDWFGKKPTQQIEGLSLNPLMKDNRDRQGKHRLAYMQYTFRGREAEALFDGQRKVISYLDQEECYVYNLRKDPMEKKQIRKGRIVKKMLAKLKNYKDTWQISDAEEMPSKTIQLPDDIEKSLRNLGYINPSE